MSKLLLLLCAILCCPVRASSPSVYFTPHQAVDQLVLKTAEKTRHKIYLACYNFSWKPLQDVLVQLKKKNVQVQILVENLSPNFPQELLTSVKTDFSPSLFHAKFITVDGRYLLIGSLNFSSDSLFLNHNNILVFEDPQLTSTFEKRFQAWYEDKPGPAFYQKGNVTAAFSPHCDCETAICNTLQHARQSIHFLQFQFTSRPVAEILVKKSLTGCQVFGLIEATTSGDFSVFPFLFDLGVNIRRTLLAGLLHDKSFIVDGRTVITGSYNPTASARKNKECLLIIQDEDLARNFMREWKRLWRWKSLPEKLIFP